MDFVIVSETRGDAVLGFRVMQKKYSRTGEGHHMVRKGPRFYKVEDARQYRMFLESQESTQVEIKVIG